MRRHSLYVIQQITGPFLVVVFSLTGVVWLTQSLRFVDLIINKGLGFGIFMQLTLLLLPSLLAVILPIALFAAVLYAHHRMVLDSEIVVMKAVGFSNITLARPALMMGLLVMLVAYAINLYFMPVGFRTFKDLEAQIRNSYASILLREGMFNTPVEGLTVYVRDRSSDGKLRGILVHDNRDLLEPTTVMAETGFLVKGDDGPRFVLENGNQQKIETDKGDLSMLHFDRYVFDFGAVTDMADTRFRQAEERFLDELLWPTDVVEARHRREFLAEAHRRLSAPLHALVFVLLGLAPLLSGEFNRRGERARILVAVGAAIAFEALVFGLASLSARMNWLIPTLYLVPVIVAVAAWYVMIVDPFRRRALRDRPSAPAAPAAP